MYLDLIKSVSHNFFLVLFDEAIDYPLGIDRYGILYVCTVTLSAR